MNEISGVPQSPSFIGLLRVVGTYLHFQKEFHIWLFFRFPRFPRQLDCETILFLQAVTTQKRTITTQFRFLFEQSVFAESFRKFRQRGGKDTDNSVCALPTHLFSPGFFPICPSSGKSIKQKKKKKKRGRSERYLSRLIGLPSANGWGRKKLE